MPVVMAYKGVCPLTNLRNSVSKAYKCVAIAPLKERLHQERAMNALQTYFPGVARVFFTCLYMLSFNRQKFPAAITVYKKINTFVQHFSLRNGTERSQHPPCGHVVQIVLEL